MTLEQYLTIISTIISIAAILASALPKPKQERANKFIGIARKILDIIAFNFGHAKNQSRPDDKL